MLSAVAIKWEVFVWAHINIRWNFRKLVVFSPSDLPPYWGDNIKLSRRGCILSLSFGYLLRGYLQFSPCMSEANGKILRNFWKSFQKYPAIRLKKFLIIVRGIFIGYSATRKTNTFLRGTTWVMAVFSLIRERQNYTFSWMLNKERTATQRYNASKQSAAVVRNR